MAEKKVKIILHGKLKELYSETLELTGNTAAELINGMCKVTKAFNPKPGQPRHEIAVLGFESESRLKSPLSDDIKELHLVPSMNGGKRGGFFQIVVGAVLIAAAFAFPATIGAWGAMGAGVTSSFAFSIGFSLVMGGLLGMLSPTPEADNFGNGEADPEASKYLASSGNTVKIGTRIPLVYGRFRIFGHYLSFDVDAVDYDPTQGTVSSNNSSIVNVYN
jgi:predicted phage tail protein